MQLDPCQAKRACQVHQVDSCAKGAMAPIAWLQAQGRDVKATQPPAMLLPLGCALEG